MKGVVIFVILLFISMPICMAKEISIPELFEAEKVSIFQDSGKEVYYYAGNKLIAVNDEYQFQNRLNTNINSDTLPFGQEISNNERISFTGKELDQDLYYFGARYYDSNFGKFTTIDPIKDNHAYSYVSNSPTRFIDPTGMDEEEEKPLLLHMEVDPRFDGNGFFQNQEYIDPEIYDDYRVVKRIIRDPYNFFETIREVYEEFGEIELLIYGFHGRANGFHVVDRFMFTGFDRERSRLNFEEDHTSYSWVTSQSIMERGMNPMRQYFSETATCVGMSCSNAAPSEWAYAGYGNVQYSLALALGIPVQSLLTSNWNQISRDRETNRVEIGADIGYRAITSQPPAPTDMPPNPFIPSSINRRNYEMYDIEVATWVDPVQIFTNALTRF